MQTFTLINLARIYFGITGNVPSPGTYFFDCSVCDLIHRVDIGVKAGTSANPASIDGAELFRCHRGVVLRGSHCNNLNIAEIFVRSEDDLLTDEKEVSFTCPACGNMHVAAASGWISPTEIPNDATFGDIIEEA